MTAAAQTVLITGAAGHLGRATAAAFDAAGASLVLVDRRPEMLEQAYGGSGERRLLAAADLLDAREVEAAVAAAAARFGGIDALCHIAGGFRMGDAVHETSDETWQWLFDINVRTLLRIAAAVVPRMVAGGGGRIVTVGAMSARQGLARMGAYCAAKDAVIRLSESMAAELQPHGIRVNCLLPSIIDTPDNRAAMPDADRSAWVAAADIAQAFVFLTSDRGRAVGGVALPVTGTT